MKYFLIVKSHCEASDMEAVIEAKNRPEALNTFFKMYGNYGWTKEMLRDQFIREDEFNSTALKCDICNRGYLLEEEKENILITGKCIPCEFKTFPRSKYFNGEQYVSN